MKEKSVLNKKEEDELLGSAVGKEEIVKDSSISWDGLNLLVRIPKEIARYLDINEGDRFKKNLRFIITEENGKIEKRFEIIERTNPRRRSKNDKKSR